MSGAAQSPRKCVRRQQSVSAFSLHDWSCDESCAVVEEGGYARRRKRGWRITWSKYSILPATRLSLDPSPGGQKHKIAPGKVIFIFTPLPNVVPSRSLARTRSAMLTVAPATSEVAEGRLHVANATLKSWSCIRNTVSIPMQPLGCMCKARVAMATHRVPPCKATLALRGGNIIR